MVEILYTSTSPHCIASWSIWLVKTKMVSFVMGLNELELKRI